MAIRAIALSLAILIGLGTLIPLSTEYVEAGAKKTKRYKSKKRQWRGVKPYSKRWWQLYRAQERRKKASRKAAAAQRAAVARRQRSLRLRQLRLAKARQAKQNRQVVATARTTKAAPARPAKAVLPTGDSAPKGWETASASPNELKFRVTGNSGVEAGTAAISVVGPATGETVGTGMRRAVGGVPTTSLRREVINQMIRENGWVVNDYQKEVGGKTVYVVVAQSQSGSQVNSRLFYFTEAGGRIYSVATNSATGSAEQLASESEKVVQSLHNGRSVQQAAVKE